jgi:hypothetical protein
MNNLDQNQLGFFNVGRDHWEVPMRVRLRAYLDFTRRINIQLRRLTEQYEGKTPPKTNRFYRPNQPR